jgi:hypothetical protein
MTVINLNAGNDRNGNPRRLLVIIDSAGTVIDVVDEGYQGVMGALREAGYEEIAAVQAFVPRFETTPKEYNDLRARASALRLQKNPFRKAITDNYKVDSSGRIKSPGKFEGEMIYVPHFWDVFMNGGSDEELANGTLVFEVDFDERAAFPELKTRKTVKLRERDDGFVIEV